MARLDSTSKSLLGLLMNEDFDYNEAEPDEEPPVDEFEQGAVPAIEELISEQRVVTEREVKVRLEDRFFPWVTGRALRKMVEKGMILQQGLAGRRGRMEIKNFYSLPDLKYDDIIGLMREKKAVAREVNAMLTGPAPATYFAEDLFERAFQTLGFEIIDRDASYYEGFRVTRVKGKVPPNIDFVIKRDKVTYGADIKNWLRYEVDTREEIRSKVNVALQLNVVPFVIARYADKATIFKDVIEKGEICYPYKTLIFPPDLDSLAIKASRVLGYPVIALDRLPLYKMKHIDFLHRNYLSKHEA